MDPTMILQYEHTPHTQTGLLCNKTHPSKFNYRPLLGSSLQQTYQRPAKLKDIIYQPQETNLESNFYHFIVFIYTWTSKPCTIFLMILWKNFELGLFTGPEGVKHNQCGLSSLHRIYAALLVIWTGEFLSLGGHKPKSLSGFFKLVFVADTVVNQSCTCRYLHEL